MKLFQQCLLASIVLIGIIAPGEALSQDAEKSSVEQVTSVEQADLLINHLTSLWTGDLDGVLKDRMIRALVTQTRTMYFVDRAKRHGIAYEIVVTGPASPEIGSLDDLSGQTVFVRPSSSYWEHLEGINRRFTEEGKAPVQLKPAPEQLENADLMEMVNAELIGIVIVDDYNARLWAEVLPNIQLHSEIQVNSGGEFAWMMRKSRLRQVAKGGLQGAEL